MQVQTISIIGAGIGGLAVAVRMAALGYSVDVFEQNAFPGGKMGEIRHDGFRFDTGPSLFTLPQLLDDVLKPGESKDAVSFTYKRLNPVCHYFYEDGTKIKAFSHPVEFARELLRQTGEPSRAILNYLTDARHIYEASADVFIFKPIGQLIHNALRMPFSKLKHLLAVNPFISMHSENSKRFKSPHVIQLFDRYATYNGSSPYLAPATLSVISHLEHNMGAFFPDRGMYSIVEALYRRALALGVTFHFNTRVTGLSYSEGRVTGIKTKDASFAAHSVISDMDVNTFYRQVAPQIRAPRLVRKPRLSSSALIFYWGMNRQFSQLDVHNILFSTDYKEEFRQLFEEKELYHDPSIYLFVSSKQIPRDAPAGCENWFVMINVPSMEHHNWQEMKVIARQVVARKIERILGVDPLPHIVFEKTTTPQTIQDVTGSYKGALYGNNSNSLFSAFLRHPNRSRQFKNLYFTGGSVHPGGGIPLCLASAKLVEEAIRSSK